MVMDNLMYLIVMWLAAILFIIIGIYAMNRKKPMWLGAGSQISESNINDVKAYNRAIGKMWCVFSIPLFVGGIVEFILPIYSILILALTCTVGIGLIVWYYHKIEEKYFVK